MTLADYQCSICEDVIPNRRHCSVGAVGFAPFFNGFAALSKNCHACDKCIRPLFPSAIEKPFFDAQPACRLCDRAKTRNITRLRLHIPEELEHLFSDPEAESYGCYECVDKNLISVLNAHFAQPSNRINCPDCEDSLDSKALLVADITKMGSLSFGDLLFTCRSCFKLKLGWEPW